MRHRAETGVGRAIVLPALAVFGGWLIVLPGSVVSVALRLEQLDPLAPTRYSLTLAAGWLVLVASLIGFGRLGDRLRRTRGSRAAVATLAMPVAAACAMLLAAASSPGVLSAAWIALQLPAGAIIATAVGIAAERVPLRRRGIASGLVGVAPIVSVLVGSLVIGVLGADVALGAGLLVLLGIAAAIPAMLVRVDVATASVPAPDSSAGHPAPIAGAASLGVIAWVGFLAADLLLSWATSTGNGYLVLLIDTLGADDLGPLSSAATRIVSVATLVAVVSAVVGGLLSRSGVATATVFAAGTLAVGIGLLVTVLAPTAAGLLVAAVAFGGGFGAANGAELALAMQVRGHPDELGGDLGLLNAVTSVPYVLAPAVAAVLLAGDVATGLRGLYGLAIAMAVLGSLLALRVRARLRAATMGATAG